MNESCHIWMSHATYEWVVSHMNESCHIWMSHATYECVMSHIEWMSHVTYRNRGQYVDITDVHTLDVHTLDVHTLDVHTLDVHTFTCTYIHTNAMVYTYVTSTYSFICDIAHMHIHVHIHLYTEVGSSCVWECACVSARESASAHAWCTAFEACPIWMSYFPYESIMSHMDESCPIWLGHVAYGRTMSHTNESCPIWMGHVPYEWVVSHINDSIYVPYERVVSHMNESCPIGMSPITYMSHVPSRDGREVGACCIHIYKQIRTHIPTTPTSPVTLNFYLHVYICLCIYIHIYVHTRTYMYANIYEIHASHVSHSMYICHARYIHLNIHEHI